MDSTIRHIGKVGFQDKVVSDGSCFQLTREGIRRLFGHIPSFLTEPRLWVFRHIEIPLSVVQLSRKGNPSEHSLRLICE